MLRAAERLKRDRDFKRVYAAKRAVVHPLMVLYSRPAASGRRIGFSVSKKLGGAVKRNRVKRRLREACRSADHVLKDGFDAIIVARSRIAEASYSEIEAVVTELFCRAGLAQRKMLYGSREARSHELDDQSLPGDGKAEP